MKTVRITILALLLLAGTSAFAQKKTHGERYGNTLNAGIGIGYYGYLGSTAPVFHINYEFDVARNFTLAPFLTYFSYKDYYYWGGPAHLYRDYSYRQTVMPVGVKGSYYFDDFLGAGPRWDFYLAASLGVAIRKTIWEDGYNGSYVVDHGTTGLYLDGHIGTEYHLSKKAGIVLDLSSGISTLCLAIHL